MRTVQTAVFLFMLILSGCQNPDRAAYVTAGTVITSVDSAMNAWGDFVRAGLSKPEQEVRVKDAYQKYQIATRTLRTVVRSYKNSPQDEARYETALRVVEAASADLISIVRQFTKNKI